MTRPHGYARYKLDGCRCGDCHAAMTAYNKRRDMGLTAGTWQPWTDAAPVRAHLQTLSQAGIGSRRVAELADVDRKVVIRIVNGGPGARPPARRVRPAHAAAILALQAAPDALAAGTNVDATGTRRRIQALCCMGWTLTAQANRVGYTTSNFARLLNQEQVLHRNAALVRGLYDDLSMTRAPAGYGASRATGDASRHRWFPPLAWDEEQIDDPAAVPVLLPPIEGSDPAADEWAIQHVIAGHRDATELNGIDRSELVLRLVANGETHLEIGRRLHVARTRSQQIHAAAVAEARRRVADAVLVAA